MRLTEREKRLLVESWKNPEVTVQDLADHLKMGVNSVRTLLWYYGAERRQRLYSAEERAAALDLVRQGVSDKEVASKLNIKRSTIRRWRNAAGIVRKPGRAKHAGTSIAG